ncbi:MAG: CdaR family protein [Prevotella sp.]
MGRQSISRMVRNFLLSTINGEFLIFLFFLALSGVFWLLMTLNETYEREFKVPVKIVNVPENIVLTSNESDTVRVTLRDKGLVLAGYIYGEGIRAVSVNFKQYAKNSTGHAVVTMSEISRMIYQQLSASTKIVSTKNDKVEIFFNYGLSKKIPTKWTGRVVPEHLYFISNVDYMPDSVTVYASQEKLDSILTAETEVLNVTNFRDTLTMECSLQKIKGVKFVPDKVKVRFMTDVLTEESFDEIPVVGVNVPEGKVLRTFPSKVSVRFVTGVSRFRNLNRSDFVVEADFNDLQNSMTDKCRIYLRSVPHGVSRASLSVQQVDYLIEDE